MTTRWSARACRNLGAIYDYIAQDNESAAAQFVERLLRAGDALSQHPNIGRPGRHEGTRELILSPYLLVYRVKENVVSIEAVVHGRRRYD